MSIKSFLESRDNFTKFVIVCLVLDLSSTFSIVYRWGMIAESNPIMKFLIPKPYFPIVYVLVFSFIVSLIKPAWSDASTGRKLFLWLLFFIHFISCGVVNTVGLFVIK